MQRHVCPIDCKVVCLEHVMFRESLKLSVHSAVSVNSTYCDRGGVLSYFDIPIDIVTLAQVMPVKNTALQFARYLTW